MKFPKPFGMDLFTFIMLLVILMGALIIAGRGEDLVAYCMVSGDDPND